MGKNVLLCVLIGFFSIVMGGERVIRIADESQVLNGRWAQAFESKNGLKKSCWIGYGIDVVMDEDINMHYGNRNPSDPTLDELLFGQIAKGEVNVRDAARVAFDRQSPEQREKRFCILLQFAKDTRRAKDCTEIFLRISKVLSISRISP